MKIYKVFGSLDKTGLNRRFEEIEVEEKDKCFIGNGKRISKDKLMKIDTIFFENHKCLKYFTYCLENDKQNALNILKEHIVKKAKLYKEEIDLLNSYL